MKDKYDWRIRIMDKVAEPLPSGTRMTVVYKKRNPMRVPALWASMIAAMIISCIIAVNGGWLIAIIPMLYPLFILSMNLIEAVRWFIKWR